MISMAGIGSAGGAAGYYTKDNYYTDRDASQASAWTGAGADAAELSGTVDADAFKAVLEGTMPDGSIIPARPGGKHAPGMDITFSAPKSVSLMAYIGGDKRLLEAHTAAVKTTLAWAEKNLAETRISKDGKVETVKTGNLVLALFQHDTNRNLDPQLHTHAIIPNATKGPDGKWHALHNGKLWDANSLLGSIYHAALRANVNATGHETVAAGKYGVFEIDGVPRSGIDTFSTRRTEILSIAKKALDWISPQGLREVTKRSRADKDVVGDRDELRQTWRDRAAAIGLNLQPLVDAAHARVQVSTNPNIWDRMVQGIRDGAARAGAVTEFVRRHAGHDTAEIDPYLPNHSSRMKPGEFGAANAVASAIRHLSQNETSFELHALYKAALGLGLPVQIDGVERSVTRLIAQGKLIAGTGHNKHQLTTPAAIATEHKIFYAADVGRSATVPIVADPAEAGRRVQEAAQQRNGFTLNPGQENAARLLLSSSDRVINIQGVAGAGKSAALGPAADVIRASGRNVIGLGVAHVAIQKLTADSGIQTTIIAKFLRTHEKLLLNTTWQSRLDLARGMFKDAVVVVDEASMLSNEQTLKLLNLANKLDFKIGLVGDKRQLGAVEAGKPFEGLQARNVATAEMPENLRARTRELQEAASLANTGNAKGAFERLSSTVTEVGQPRVEETSNTPPEQLSAVAAAKWLALSPDDRAGTLLLASGKRIRGEVNNAVQAGLLEEGSISEVSALLTVLDKVSLTREEERQIGNYKIGQTIEFARELKSQNISRGRGEITEVDQKAGVVRIRRENGRIDQLSPTRLAFNRRENTHQLSEKRELTVHEGDIIRWTANAPERGIANSAKAQITAINDGALTMTSATGMAITLPLNDKMRENLDLGYAMNAHMNQGVTSDRAIGVIDSRETNLTNGRLFLVQITRVRDGIELVVNDRERVAQALQHRSGDKTSAFETIGAIVPQRSTSAPPVTTAGRLAARVAARAKSAALPATGKPVTHDPTVVTTLERSRERQLDFGL